MHSSYLTSVQTRNETRQLSLPIKSLCQLCRIGESFVFLFSIMTIFNLNSKGFVGVVGTNQASDGMDLLQN